MISVKNISSESEKDNYNLLTSDGNYKVEIGDLDNIDFKVKGFKTFVEKYLVYQNPEKYKKISVKYNNQIVTTLNPYFKENDSILRNAPKIEITKPEEKPTQSLASVPTKTETKKSEPKKEIKKAEPKKSEVKKETSKPKKVEKKSEPKKSSEKKKETTSKSSSDKKKKAKVVVE